MKSLKRDLHAIVSIMIAKGLLSDDERTHLEKSLRLLDHSVAIKDSHGIRKSINAMCRLFIK